MSTRKNRSLPRDNKNQIDLSQLPGGIIDYDCSYELQMGHTSPQKLDKYHGTKYLPENLMQGKLAAQKNRRTIYTNI